MGNPTNPNRVVRVKDLNRFKVKNDALYATQAGLDAVEDAIGIDTSVEFVDLGLPSGTLWAKCNIGADSETDYGNYYMYGKGSRQYNSGDSGYSGEEDPMAASADTATQVMGAPWHMPTKDQIEELIANTTYSWQNNFNGSGKNGMKLTASNGNYIFFPAAGTYKSTGLVNDGTNVCVWSSTPYVPPVISYFLSAYKTGSGASLDGSNTVFGYSVRGVMEPIEKRKADRDGNATEGNLAVFDSEGNPVDSGYSPASLLDGTLYPVDVNTLTPSSTFVKNAIIGINGVIYRSKRATSHFPVVLTVSGSSFVVDIVNGKIAFVVSDPTIDTDWEQWTDAAIEYWKTQLDARVSAIEAESPSTALHPNDTYGGHSVSSLLNAMASLMNKTIVVDPTVLS